MKSALITGVSGQGGAYLAKNLVEHGFSVTGTSRDVTQADVSKLNILGIGDEVSLRSLDLQNAQSVIDLIDQLRPDEIYHLAAPSSVARSFHEPAETIYSIVLTTVNVLDAIRKTDKNIPCFIASSTEVFGNCDTAATHRTLHDPKSPYGIGKSCAFYQARNYRDAYGLFVSCGILSNFESPLRPRNYVTSKIVSTACKIALHEASSIELGNLSIRRDWGSAIDFMEAVRRSLQQEAPRDYLIATGVTSSLEDFLSLCFSCLDLDYRDYLITKESLLRPLDIQQTLCDVSATQRRLDWQAESSLEDVVKDMLFAELTLSVGSVKATDMLGLNKSNVVQIPGLSRP